MTVCRGGPALAGRVMLIGEGGNRPHDAPC